jgi:hypothetical protein
MAASNKTLAPVRKVSPVLMQMAASLSCYLPKIASPERTKVTPQEAQAINVGSIACYGTYTVDEPSKTLLLNIESSTYPNQLGTQAKRVITSVTADELKYTNTTPIGGGPITAAFKRTK